jgi:hypothetical protein
MRLLPFDKTEKIENGTLTSPATRCVIFTELSANNNAWIVWKPHSLSCVKAQKTNLLLLLVFFAVGTCLPKRRLAKKGIICLPIDNRRHEYICTQTDGRDLCSRRWDGHNCQDTYAKFHKIGSGTQKLLGGYGDTQTHRRAAGRVNLR